jgi:membrane protein implicated in regulation of membrane protease activity
MTWTTMYLGCFLLGFSLSLVSWLFGAFRLHLPHGFHAHGLPHAHAPAHPHAPGHAHGAPRAAGPSPYNFATLTAFLAWFGGAGYLLTVYAGVWPLLALAISAIVGCAGAAAVFAIMAKVLWSPDENLNPDDYEIVGLLGTVCSPIRQNGTGEILFSQAGARRVAGARSEGGAAIDKGVEVVITRYQNGLAYVRTWTEHASEEAI